MLGHTYGYYTEDPQEAWVIDSTLDSISDEYDKLFMIVYETDTNKKKDR